MTDVDMIRVRKVCPACRSGSVAATGNVAWSVDEQAWCVGDVHGESWCRDCKAEFDEQEDVDCPSAVVSEPASEGRFLVRLAIWWHGGHDPVQIGYWRDGGWHVPGICAPGVEAAPGAVIGYCSLPDVPVGRQALESEQARLPKAVRSNLARLCDAFDREETAGAGEDLVIAVRTMLAADREAPQ